LIVPAMWLLARRFVSSGWSLVAAGCAVTSLLYFCFATQGRPHAMITVAIVLAVVASIDAARKGTLRASLLAGLACGASTAILHNGVATLLPLAVAHAIRWRRDGRSALVRFAASLVPFVAIFLLANPSLLPELFSPDAQSGPGGAAFLLSHDVAARRFHGGGASAVFRAFAYFDPLLLIAAAGTLVVGSIRAFARKDVLRGARDELLVVLAFVVPYLVVLMLFEETHYRFALPLVPFAALFAVLGLRSLGRAGVVASAVLLLAQTASVIQLVRLHAAQDTYEQAAAWIEQHLDRSTARISISPWLELPLVRARAALAAHGLQSQQEVAHWLDHQRAMPDSKLDALGWSIVDLPLRRGADRAAFNADSSAFLRALNTDYLVIDVFEGQERPMMTAVRNAARAVGRLEARFTPRGADSERARQLEPYAAVELWDDYRFIEQLWISRALGDCIEIYRFER
jgi:hypothetical protein